MTPFPPWLKIAVLIVVGVLLIFFEFFFPGMILGTMAVAALAAAAVIAFKQYPDYWAMVAIGEVVGAAIIIYLVFRFFPRTPMGRRLILHTSETEADGYVDTPHSERSHLVGKCGKAITHLRPSGFALIDGRRVDVVTEGEFIDVGSEIEVVGIEGNRVFVRLKAFGGEVTEG